ncbi:MAG: hypothetical protein K0R39_3499 [Symbiobacteriaceae bacterium]|nr:hypothetical protein [Symbiobacteriaceae bacterium]
MRLCEVVLENYRGFPKPWPVDLDAQALLFYGPNGRGKSTIFSALELALFPTEVLAEYRREMGARAPLVNLFSGREVGSITITVAGDGGDRQSFVQEVRQGLFEIKVGSASAKLSLEGQRYRLFFNQRLLRDLMFGIPERRHERVKQLLGCEGYDGLIREIFDWVDGLGAASNRLTQQEKAIRSAETATRELSRKYPVWGSQVLREPFQLPTAVAHASRAITESLMGSDKVLFEFACSELNTEAFWGLMLSVKKASKKVRSSKEILEKMKPGQATVDFATVRSPALPAAWMTALNEALSDNQRVDALATEFASRCETFIDSLEGWHAPLDLLGPLDEAVAVAKALGVDTLKDARSFIRKRRLYLRFTRFLYRTLLELVDRELESRIGLVTERWNQYYRSIAAFSHFQYLDMVLVRSALEKRHQPWSVPPERWSLIRFLADDRAKPDRSTAFGMENLLSEGQLNCAVVALILALSGADGEVSRPPLQLLALDDPFVSWDDVNLENFMLTIRQLAKQHPDMTILLSACDQRVVHSFRQNMETVALERPAKIYAFTAWDKVAGPAVKAETVATRRPVAAFLKDLEGDFEGIPLEVSVPRKMEADVLFGRSAQSERPHRYFILTTNKSECHQRLMKDLRFDHIYREQPGSGVFVQEAAAVPVADGPIVHFIYYNRVPGHPEFRQLGPIYRMADVLHDREAGPSPRGRNSMYSLFLEKVGSVGRPFAPGTKVWESLPTTRGKEMKDFFSGPRVLIPISEYEYQTILSLG